MKRKATRSQGDRDFTFLKTWALGNEILIFPSLTLSSDASETPAVDEAFLRADNEPRRPER